MILSERRGEMAVVQLTTLLYKLFLSRALVAELNKMPPVVTGPVSQSLITGRQTIDFLSVFIWQIIFIYYHILHLLHCD